MTETFSIDFTANRTRSCGGCTLCCKLLPVRELQKKGGERCRHQRTGKGCAVYRKPELPLSCRLWSCKWLIDDTAMFSRPDRLHCVIDIMPDFVQVLDHATGQMHSIEAVQLWCDPRYPDAHRDPELRAYLERYCEKRRALVLVRYSEEESMPLLPPFMNNTGEWVEHRDGDNRMVKRTHTADEVFAAIGRYL